MINDAAAVAWKEIHELLSGAGRGKFAPLVLVAIDGVFVPLQAGRRWIDSYQVVGFAMAISVFLVLSIVADTFAGERERHTLETLLASRLTDRAILVGKITTVVCYGWGLTMVSLVTGLIVVNLKLGGGHLLLYPGGLATATVVLSFLLTILSAGIGVLVSLRASTVRQAQQVLTVGWVAVIFLILFGVRALPPSTRADIIHRLNTMNLTTAVIALIVVLVVLDVLVVAIDTIRFQRSRLILD